MSLNLKLWEALLRRNVNRTNGQNKTGFAKKAYKKLLKRLHFCIFGREAGGTGVQGYPQLDGEFKSSQVYKILFQKGKNKTKPFYLSSIGTFQSIRKNQGEREAGNELSLSHNATRPKARPMLGSPLQGWGQCCRDRFPSLPP